MAVKKRAEQSMNLKTLEISCIRVQMLTMHIVTFVYIFMHRPLCVHNMDMIRNWERDFTHRRSHKILAPMLRSHAWWVPAWPGCSSRGSLLRSMALWPGDPVI